MPQLLDELTGFEFEDLMEDVFRNLGYQNVRQAAKTGDEGRDIIMEERVNGRTRAVIVECKHTNSVGRPVIQKLHSAVSTFDYDGPRRGIVVTTGTFTGPAKEYASDLQRDGDDGSIELLDGTDLREIGEEIGLDLYNGQIEVVCEETLRPTHPTGPRDKPAREAFHEIENLDPQRIGDTLCEAVFKPTLEVAARVDATFETNVGVIHQVNTTDRLSIAGDRGRPEILSSSVDRLVQNNRSQAVDMDIEKLEKKFDKVDIEHFDRTETEYKDWVVNRLRRKHTETVHYTGDNNVDYEKTCEPRQSDISVQSIDPVYVPKVSIEAQLGEYRYPYECYVAGPSHTTIEDGIRECVHCDTSGRDETYTFCENCGSINCNSHIKTERIEQEPVCTGCAVTERFALKTKYFYDEQNREQFRQEYEQMAAHEKAMENPPLVATSAVAVVLTVLFILTQVGFV
ncbi:restriction endonuclease [Halapricum desulfuricans]|nr:restriction endonuclease [Halapricum desulfuricans]